MGVFQNSHSAKKKYRSRLVLLLSALSILPSQAFACGTTHCPDVTIEKMYAIAKGKVWLFTSGDESALTNCTAAGGDRVTIDLDDPAGEAVYALALTLKAQNKVVTAIGLIPSAGNTTAAIAVGECVVNYIRHD